MHLFTCFPSCTGAMFSIVNSNRRSSSYIECCASKKEVNFILHHLHLCRGGVIIYSCVDKHNVTPKLYIEYFLRLILTNLDWVSTMRGHTMFPLSCVDTQCYP
jgi:hypothetical protein